MKLIKKYTNKVSLGLCFGMLTFTGMTLNPFINLQAHEHQASIQQLANELEISFWTSVQNHNAPSLNETIAEIFQGIGAQSFFPAGSVITRDEELTLLLSSSITSFTIDNLVATKKHDVLVVSYVFEYIGTGLQSGPMINVWKKMNGRWKLVNQSNVFASLT